MFRKYKQLASESLFIGRDPEIVAMSGSSRSFCSFWVFRRPISSFVSWYGFLAGRDRLRGWWWSNNYELPVASQAHWVHLSETNFWWWCWKSGCEAFNWSFNWTWAGSNYVCHGFLQVECWSGKVQYTFFPGQVLLVAIIFPSLSWTWKKTSCPMFWNILINMELNIGLAGVYGTASGNSCTTFAERFQWGGWSCACQTGLPHHARCLWATAALLHAFRLSCTWGEGVQESTCWSCFRWRIWCLALINSVPSVFIIFQ